jgi:cation:H+ antiporter
LFLDVVIFIVALSVLIYGADFIINESEKIALKFGISEYIIGATLIALGTSLPEMAASINASINGKPELSISNIVGSNILNITLVLGLVFILAKKINPNRDFFKKDSAWALFPVLIFIVAILNGKISRFTGFVFMLLMGAYILFITRHDKDVIDLADIDKEELQKSFSWAKSIPLLILGFLMVVYGADYTVSSASNIAKFFGVSDWVIGVVLVALGTSMPELVVSVSAAVKGKADMAIGNIIGSNMANITIAVGAAAVANPIAIDFSKYTFDIVTMLVATLMLVFITVNKMYSKPSGISLLILLAIFMEHTINSVIQ